MTTVIIKQRHAADYFLINAVPDLRN